MTHAWGHVWVNNLSPFLFHVTVRGHELGVRWYGLSYLLGFVFVYLWFARAARDKTVPGLTPAALDSLVTAVVVGVLGGGRLGFVLQHPVQWAHDPLWFFRVWEGGMAFFGGLLGTLLAFAWVGRRFGLSLPALLDVAVFPTALGLAVGRLANFVNGELVGKPTRSDWGVVFPGVDTLPRHPSQLYESASHFLLFGILLLTARRFPAWTHAVSGRLTALFLAVYGFLRFGTDFFRDDDVYFGPAPVHFSSGQWASVILCAAGLVWLARCRKPSVLPITN